MVEKPSKIPDDRNSIFFYLLRIVSNPRGVAESDVVKHVLLYKFHVVNSQAKDNLSFPNEKIYLHKFLFSALQTSSRNWISKVAISVLNGGGKKLSFHKAHCSELSFQMT